MLPLHEKPSGGVTWAHVNDVSKATLQSLLPSASIVSQGDCGSVWGEYHSSLSPCPWPHLLVRFPTDSDLLALVVAGVGYCVDYTEEWGEHSQEFFWREDPDCVGRPLDLLEDHRHYYGVQ